MGAGNGSPPHQPDVAIDLYRRGRRLDRPVSRFRNVGQLFMSIALSNSISRTLPKERAGVGMGLFSMLNFMSQAIAAGIYGRAIDAGAAASWNPANASGRGFVFSNIYLVLAVLLLAVLAVYYFRQIRTRSADVGLGH
ncbi:hypothetical protein [Cohnella massiliensis]|uniref:hypothetical protein n=1 Tax=Cohnella massiliensis TaxID=1816691 RepID=UPI0009BC62FB|nr:hypothetical protein [Cohnella massiliensis]